MGQSETRKVLLTGPPTRSRASIARPKKWASVACPNTDLKNRVSVAHPTTEDLADQPPSLVPHSAQNFAPAGFCALQFGQATVEVIAAPQSLQNFAEGAFFAPHFGHATVTAAAAAGGAAECGALR